MAPYLINKFKNELNYLNLELNREVYKLSDLLRSLGFKYIDIIYISTINDIILYEGNSIYLKRFYRVLSGILMKYFNLPQQLFDESNRLSIILINIIDVIDDIIIIKNKLGENIIQIPVFLS